MKILRKLLFVTCISLLACGFISSARAQSARVDKVVGSAEVQLPGEATFKPVIKGMVVPVGATIKTAKDGQVFLAVFDGGIAAVQADTTVVIEKVAVEKQGDLTTSQDAMVDLKQGTVVSILDPSKKAINHYGVRTPKGVAAARGTTYVVTVNGEKYTVITGSGTVTITSDSGASVECTNGNVSINGATAVAGSTLTGDDAAQANLFAAIAAATVAQVAANANNEFGTNAAAGANAELAEVIQNLCASLPDAVSQIVASAVAQAPELKTEISNAAKAGAPDQATAIDAAADQGEQGETSEETPITPVDVTEVSSGG